MSGAPSFYEDLVGDGVTVLTVFDGVARRWTTAVIGGPIDGWQMIYRDEDDPVVQHTKAIETAREAQKHAGNGDVGGPAVAGGLEPAG